MSKNKQVLLDDFCVVKKKKINDLNTLNLIHIKFPTQPSTIILSRNLLVKSISRKRQNKCQASLTCMNIWNLCKII